MSELSNRLARLAKRGTERGADAVFTAAQKDAARPPVAPIRSMRKLQVVTAIAAGVLVLGGAVAALSVDGSSTDAPARRSRSAAAVTTTMAVPTTSTTASPATKVYLASTRLVPFDQCASLSRYAQTKALAVVGPYGLPGVSSGGPMLVSGNAGRASAGATADDSRTQAPSAPQAKTATNDDFSTTNVQEAGIDEPDTVKTDGKTIFTVANQAVYATAAGANPTLLGSVKVDGASDLLLAGDRLIVISANNGIYATDGPSAEGKFAPQGPPRQVMARFSVFDVSDPTAMKSAGSFNVDGNYVSARLVDGVARVVVQSSPRFDFAYPTDGTPEAQTAAAQHNRDIVQAATVDSWLPHFSYTTPTGTQINTKPSSTCATSYRPPSFAGFGMLSVISFNANSPADSHTTSVMADGNIVYASASRLYVATNQWGAVTPDNVVQPTANTLIHAFDISDSSNATYLFSGQVRGTVLNQFSMSEYAGAFRVATTDPNGGSESFLTILGDAGNALVPVGQVGGLGKGERIYAVRFIDDVAYVVTFKQTDPLYVVNLTVPSKPRVVGELALTGYSAYLHPIGPGLLLGIGQEATPEGRRAGVQASVFDVSNPAAPRLVTRKVLEQGNTSVEFDHHAFLYWAKTKLAVLPLSTYSHSLSGQNFNGAVGLHIGDASIDEVGRLQPPANPQSYNGLERTLVINGRLFATSNGGIVVATLDTLTQTAWMPYPAP